MQTLIPDYNHGNQIILRPVQHFCRFVPKFARVAEPMNEKLPEGQLQNFVGISEDEIAALEALKAK